MNLVDRPFSMVDKHAETSRQSYIRKERESDAFFDEDDAYTGLQAVCPRYFPNRASRIFESSFFLSVDLT